MYKLVKPLLFKLDPEKAHGLTIDALKMVQEFRKFILSWTKFLITITITLSNHSWHQI